MVGELPDVRRAGRLGFARAGTRSRSSARSRRPLDASELAKLWGAGAAGRACRRSTSRRWRAAQAAVRGAVRDGAVSSAHDIAEGGLRGRAGGVLPGWRPRRAVSIWLRSRRRLAEAIGIRARFGEGSGGFVVSGTANDALRALGASHACARSSALLAAMCCKSNAPRGAGSIADFADVSPSWPRRTVRWRSCSREPGWRRAAYQGAAASVSQAMPCMEGRSTPLSRRTATDRATSAVCSAYTRPGMRSRACRTSLCTRCSIEARSRPASRRQIAAADIMTRREARPGQPGVQRERPAHARAASLRSGTCATRPRAPTPGRTRNRCSARRAPTARSRELALAHNGNLINAVELHDELSDARGDVQLDLGFGDHRGADCHASGGAHRGRDRRGAATIERRLLDGRDDQGPRCRVP